MSRFLRVVATIEEGKGKNVRMKYCVVTDDGTNLGELPVVGMRWTAPETMFAPPAPVEIHLDGQFFHYNPRPSK